MTGTNQVKPGPGGMLPRPASQAGGLTATLNAYKDAGRYYGTVGRQTAGAASAGLKRGLQKGLASGKSGGGAVMAGLKTGIQSAVSRLKKFNADLDATLLERKAA